MRKNAFVFPGQGSQKAGMARDLAISYSEAMEIFELADRIMGFCLSKLCWEGPEEELRKTINTQPAILTTSIACLKTILREGITPLIVAGHSVGEYAALVAAGVLNFEDALLIVRKRGELMHEAGLASPGTMTAIIGLDCDTIRKVCSEIKGIVEIANFNSPDQIVISGEISAVHSAMERLNEKGARRVVPLSVGAAFHSSLMKSAAEKLAQELDNIRFREPRIPVVVNISAKALNDSSSIKEALKRQILGSVLWTDSVKTMISAGVDTFIEVGPGKILGGMIRKIDKYVQIFNVEDTKSLERTKEAMKNTVSVQ